MKKRLAIIISHPIQYYAPLFMQLHTRAVIDLKVFYTWGKGGEGEIYDHGFGKAIEWDIPLLEGYQYEFLKNASSRPGVHHFNGIDNTDIIQRICAYSPDAVLIFGWSFKSHLKALRYFFKKIPVWFRGDSTILDEQGTVKKIARALFLRWIYSHVDKAFVVGKNNYQYYIKAGMKPEQLVSSPHAVDNERFMEPDLEFKSRADELKLSLNIKKEDFVFLFAGKFEAKKDPALLLTAFQELHINNEFHLLFVGNGPLEPELKLQAGSTMNVHFMHFQNQQLMPAVYRVADAFILPSRGPNETWGLSVNEAMACGCAVIVSDKCGCAADLVENGKNGYVFKAGNISDLKQKMEMILANKKTLDAMKLSSGERIREYSLLKTCSAIENELQQLACIKQIKQEHTK